MKPVASCPNRQQLESLVQGRMPFAQVEQMAQHLEHCESCVQTIQSLKVDDTLVEVIRRQATAQGKAPDAVLNSLMERLRGLRGPLQGANATGVDPENYDFLAPAQGAGELGRLAQYRILKILGAGGMGVVFQAEDLQLKRVVALKAMKPALAASPTAKQRFVREAQATAAVKHDHLITIYQVGVDRGVPFLAMEFLEGASLEDYLKKGKPMSLGQIYRVGREIAEGLAAAHQRGLIHRDIKPANIWLEAPKGRIKILDFGLARGMDDQVQITQPGAIVGTPAYMAPEQASSTQTDHRTDLYSLGCVLYRLCTGQVPFRGDTTMATLMAMATEQPKPVTALNPSIPAPLGDLVMKLLSKKPENRYQSAKEVVAAIQVIERGHKGKQTLDAGLVLTQAGPGKIIATRNNPARPRRSKPRFALLTAAAVLLVGGAIVAYQVIIHIKTGDSKVEITAPSGASIEVEKDGKVVAKINPVAGTKPQAKAVEPAKEPVPKAEPKKEEPRVEPKEEEPIKEVPKAEPKKDPPKPAKAVVPDPASQAKADKTIKDTFKAEYAKRKPEEMLALSKALLQLGLETKDDPAARFVCLSEARDLAAQALELTASYQAIEELDKSFEINPVDMKLAMLEVAGKSVTTQATTQTFASSVQEVVEDLLVAGQFDAALRALKAAEAAASKTRSTAIFGNLQARGKEIDALRKEFLQAEKAAALLQENPDDAAANLTAGRYSCLVKGDWDQGLPLLAKGSDPKLQDLAKRDLAVPTDSGKQIELGDGWWTLASGEKGRVRAQLLSRACLWYKEALPNLTGLSKARVEKRMEESESSVGEMTPRSKKFVPLSLAKAATADTSQGVWGAPRGSGHEFIFKKWGEQTFNNIPFNVPEPKGKNNVIAFGWKYPKVASIPCNTACKTIHMLSGVSGAGFRGGIGERSLTMTIKLHYADGGTEEHELLNGVHFADFSRVNEVPGSQLAFTPIVGGESAH